MQCAVLHSAVLVDLGLSLVLLTLLVSAACSAQWCLAYLVFEVYWCLLTWLFAHGWCYSAVSVLSVLQCQCQVLRQILTVDLLQCVTLLKWYRAVRAPAFYCFTLNPAPECAVQLHLICTAAGRVQLLRLLLCC